MICASAFHSNTIGGKGGDFEIKLEEGLKEYESAKENGLTSWARLAKPGPYSILMKAVKDSKFLPFDGQLVDVSVDGKWEEGLVKKVDKLGEEAFTLKVLVDGKKEVSFTWPSNKIEFCSK
jgi:hypothetical protein